MLLLTLQIVKTFGGYREIDRHYLNSSISYRRRGAR